MKDNDAPPKKKLHGLEDGVDGSARLWFGNQLSDDACAFMAIFNVLPDVGKVDVEGRLREFRNEAERTSSSVRCASMFSFVRYLNLVFAGGRV